MQLALSLLVAPGEWDQRGPTANRVTGLTADGNLGFDGSWMAAVNPRLVQSRRPALHRLGSASGSRQAKCNPIPKGELVRIDARLENRWTVFDGGARIKTWRATAGLLVRFAGNEAAISFRGRGQRS